MLSVLNGPVADFVFRRIARPKQAGWYEANKQFIAPLPIPRADAATQAEIGAMARGLQDSWTRRRQLLADAEARLSVLSRAKHKARWLWPDLPTEAALKERAPRSLRLHEKTEWVRQQLDDLEDARLEALHAVLRGNRELHAAFSDGELKLFSGGQMVLSKIYLDGPQGKLAEAYWRFLILSRTSRDAKGFASALRRVPNGPELPAARQFVERTSDLTAETEAIRGSEKRMNERLYELYGLSTAERQLVETDCARRAIL